MCTGAEAFVVVADAYDADGVGGSFGEAAHVEAVNGFALGDEFFGYGYVFGYYGIDVVFKRFQLFRSQSSFHMIVEFGFLALYVGAEGSAAAVAACYLTVEEMFGGVHGWIFLLVMLVYDIVLHSFVFLRL